MVSTPVLIMIVMCISCTKPEEDSTPITPSPPPTVDPPTGMIDNFTITDSLMPFYTPGATLKWLVTGTNAQTVVTINGVKVNYYGILDTGPLKQTTTFTLMVNNGKQASVFLRVADSITTLMWNKGKRLKQIKKERWVLPPSAAFYRYEVDTTTAANILDQRIYFKYTGGSTIEQKTSSVYVAPGDTGKFTVSHSGLDIIFSWRGTLYTIELLDENFLIVHFDDPQPNGTKLLTRITYQYEG